MFHLIPTAMDSRLQREADVTFFEYVVMAILSEQPDHTLQLKDLAAVAHSSLSRLSHVITRLERRGWVERTPVPVGRATLARLTPSGYEKTVEAAPIHVAEVRRLIFDVLTREQVIALGEIAARINAAGLPQPR